MLLGLKIGIVCVELVSHQLTLATFPNKTIDASAAESGDQINACAVIDAWIACAFIHFLNNTKPFILLEH